MAELAQLARESGRPPFPITTFGTPRDADAVAALAEAGVDRRIFGLKAAAADAVLRRLDRIAQFVEGLR